MSSQSTIGELDIITRKEFIDLFILETIKTIYNKKLAESTNKEIEKELIKKVKEQQNYVEMMRSIQETRLITRQFVPSVMHIVRREISENIDPIPSQVREIESVERQVIDIEKPIILDSKIDELFLKKPDIIECSENEVETKIEGLNHNTGIVLSEAEIKDIIKKFSEMTKIPLIDNILRASYENYTIIAINSDKIGSRFMIYKKAKHPGII